MPGLLALLLASFVVAVVARRVAQLRRWLVVDPAELIARDTSPASIAALARAFGASASESHRHPAGEGGGGGGVDPEVIFRELAESLAEPEKKRRDALCNEALAELSRGLSSITEGHGALLRICALGTLFCCALAILSQREVGRSLLDVLGVGGGALLVVLAARREGGEIERRWREGVDAWVARSLQAWGPDEGGKAAGKVDRRRRAV